MARKSLRSGCAGTAARGNYTLNLSAYSNDGAQRLIRKVRALGYPVSGAPIRQGGRALTLVTAGPFQTRTAAEAARLKITQSIPGAPAHLESGFSDQHGDVAAAPATPTAGPARAGGYAVQVAAMGSQADANALRDKLRAAGFDGFTDSVSSGGRTLWRVRAGPQIQRTDAERVRDQIKAKLGMAGNVVSVP
jgi:cell division septation protein DedD